MSKADLSVQQRIDFLLKALEGDRRINEILSRCKDSESMIAALIEFSSKLGLELSKEDLTRTPPIRDWIWWKNKEAIVTLGSGTPRYQQDIISKPSKLNKFLSKLFK